MTLGLKTEKQRKGGHPCDGTYEKLIFNVATDIVSTIFHGFVDVQPWKLVLKMPMRCAGRAAGGKRHLDKES